MATGERPKEAQGTRRAGPGDPLRGRGPGEARRLLHARRRAPRAPRRVSHGAVALLLELLAGALVVGSRATRRRRLVSSPPSGGMNSFPVRCWAPLLAP